MANNDHNTARRLFIRVSRNSLSFSTLEASEVTFEPFPLNSSISIAANLREALRTLPLLSQSYGRVFVMVDTPVLLMPTILFNEEEEEQLYRHTFTGQNQHMVMHMVLPDLNSVAVFSVQKDLRTVLRDTFGQVRYLPVAAPVWSHLHQRSFTGKHEKLYGYFHDRQLEVFSFVQNRFRFSNTFAVNDPNDALYYLLAVWKQLGMKPEHDELYLVGDIAEREALIEDTQKFIKRVFYINPSGEFNRAAVTQIAGMPYDLVALFMKRN